MNKCEETLVLKHKCGLCGSSEKALTKTSCCNNWICDDEDAYVIFSFARNSCYRNHSRYTLCSYHFYEEHSGKWHECKKCKKDFDLPNYIDMGTNEHNFEKLENPEKVTVSCVNCKFTSDTVADFALQTSRGYFCPKKKCQEAGYGRHR
jgi:predicted nucleic-acid-binding Zn-ribbon protein